MFALLSGITSMPGTFFLKIIAVLVAAAALIAGIDHMYNQIEQAGVAKCEAQYAAQKAVNDQQIIELQKTMQAKADADQKQAVADALAQSNDSVQAANDVANKLRQRNALLTKQVAALSNQKLVGKSTDSGTVSPEFISTWNSIVNQTSLFPPVIPTVPNSVIKLPATK